MIVPEIMIPLVGEVKELTFVKEHRRKDRQEALSRRTVPTFKYHRGHHD